MYVRLRNALQLAVDRQATRTRTHAIGAFYSYYFTLINLDWESYFGCRSCLGRSILTHWVGFVTTVIQQGVTGFRVTSLTDACWSLDPRMTSRHMQGPSWLLTWNRCSVIRVRCCSSFFILNYRCLMVGSRQSQRVCKREFNCASLTSV